MKIIPVLVFVTTAFMFSCSESSNKDVKDEKENLTVAKEDLKGAEANESEDARTKETNDWNGFKNEADSSIAKMENDLKKLDAKIEKAGKKEKQKLKANYVKSKSDIEALKEKLRQKNVEFENDMKTFDNKVSEKTQSFKREFKYDMDELGRSLQDLFDDNVKYQQNIITSLAINSNE